MPVVGEGIMKKTQTTPSIADLNAIEANYQLLFKKGAMKTAPKTEDVNTRVQLAKWLALPQAGPFVFPDTYGQVIVIRVAKNEGFDYLYSQRDFLEQGLKHGEQFCFAGIYCKADGLIYDAFYSFDGLIDLEKRSRASLKATLQAEVCAVVEAAIDNDRRNLNERILSEYEDKQLSYYDEHGAAAMARRAYLADVDGSFPFRCGYEISGWEDNSLLDFISDPAAFVQREAEKYINEHQEDMLRLFITNDMLRKEYLAIMSDPQHQAHYVKRIIEATSGTQAKTFCLTIRKDGKELTFKVRGDQFRFYNDYYTAYYIAASDRKKYEKLFGHKDYYPKEIVRIEYNRVVLYQADKAEH